MFSVVRLSSDTLSKQVWRFNSISNGDGLDIVVSEYKVERRESRRHKFKADWRESYSRYHHSRQNGIDVEKVPLPADVEKEILGVIHSKIKVIVKR